ncbi:MAG TPA: preprotein translocase subunit SecG [Devosia sp.]|nr:preprotein translocase subunit SecG [Devosia sp.]
MQNVLLVAYLLIVLAMIGVILLQRSEGGGLGMGGNAGGLMTVRGSANLLTRTTAVLAALFFATAIGLTILSELDRPNDSILSQAGATPGGATNVLDTLLPADASSSAPAESSAAPAADAVSTDPGLAVPVLAPPDASSAPPDASSAAQ